MRARTGWSPRAARMRLLRACARTPVRGASTPGAPRRRRKSSVREVFAPAVRHILVVGVALAVFQQVTGINTVIYYAPTLLASAGLGTSAALLANVVNGVVNVGMTIVAIRLLDRAGRRPLLLSGTTAMAAGMLVVAEHLPLRMPQL